jgi:K+:H+ antiporter
VLAPGAHVLVTLLVVLLLGRAGALAARWARQPAVIGEIMVGLLVGPLALAVLGRRVFDTVLSPEVTTGVRWCAEFGLVLFLIGLAHKLRVGDRRPR